MLEKVIWITTCLLFGFLLSQGSWIGVVGILGLLIYFAFLTAGLYPMVVLLMVGPATFFVFINKFLDVIPFITMERLIFFSMLGLLFIKSSFNKERRIKFAPIETVMILFLIYTFLSLLSTFNDKPLSVWLSSYVSLYVQGYFIPMVSFMIARRLEWNEKNIGMLFKIFVAVGAFLGVTALLQLYFGVSIFIPDYMKLGVHSQERALGTFTNASEFGLVMSVFILIGLLVYVRSKDSLTRLILLGCLALMVVGLILSKTRAPWLGAIASLAFISLYDKRVRPLMSILTGGALLASAIVLPFFVEFDSFVARVTEVVPILNRLSVWAASLNMMFQNPVFGIGFGKNSFMESLPNYAFDMGPISIKWVSDISTTHNEFLFIAAHTGIVGIIIYLFIMRHIFQLLKTTHKDPSSSPFEKDLALYFGGIFICFIFNALLVDIGIFNYFFILMYLLFGIVAAISLKNKAHGCAQESS